MSDKECVLFVPTGHYAILGEWCCGDNGGGFFVNSMVPSSGKAYRCVPFSLPAAVERVWAYMMGDHPHSKRDLMDLILGEREPEPEPEEWAKLAALELRGIPRTAGVDGLHEDIIREARIISAARRRSKP